MLDVLSSLFKDMSLFWRWWRSFADCLERYFIETSLDDSRWEITHFSRSLMSQEEKDQPVSRLWKVIPEENLNGSSKQDFRICPLPPPSNQNFYEVQLVQIHLLGGRLCIIHARFRSLWPQTKLGLEMRDDPWAHCCRAPGFFTLVPSAVPGCQLGHGEMGTEPFGSWIVWDNNSSSYLW